MKAYGLAKTAQIILIERRTAVNLQTTARNQCDVIGLCGVHAPIVMEARRVKRSTVPVRVTEDMDEKIRGLAEMRWMTRSELIREAIAIYLSEEATRLSFVELEEALDALRLGVAAQGNQIEFCKSLTEQVMTEVVLIRKMLVKVLVILDPNFPVETVKELQTSAMHEVGTNLEDIEKSLERRSSKKS